METIEAFIAWKATHTTRAPGNYAIWLERFFKLSKKNISDVGVGEVVKFSNWLSRRYSPKTVEFTLSVVKNFFHFWRLQGVKCLASELIKIPHAVANSYQAVNCEEYAKIIDIINPGTFKGLQRLVMIRLLYETGMRVSELCDLNVSDINPKKQETTIRTRKNHLIRQIFWSAETHVALRCFLAKRRVVDETPALFIARGRITPRTVQRIIKELCRQAKLEKKITPHSFRHGKAHRVLELGGNTKDVQAILGHVNPISSFAYLQWNDCELAARAKKFLPETGERG